MVFSMSINSVGIRVLENMSLTISSRNVFRMFITGHEDFELADVALEGVWFNSGV